MSGICKKCGGSGFLLRPVPGKLVNFRRCRSCPVIPPVEIRMHTIHKLGAQP